MTRCPSSLRLVLDTNVVLDWLVFNDPALDPLRAAMRDGQVTLLAHVHAIDELTRVLGYASLKLDALVQANVLDTYRSATSLEGAGCDADMPEGFPRCRDHDDDPFLALAYRARADALISRDKAVLKLKRRAGRFGVRVVAVPEIGELLREKRRGQRDAVTLMSRS